MNGIAGHRRLRQVVSDPQKRIQLFIIRITRLPWRRLFASMATHDHSGNLEWKTARKACFCKEQRQWRLAQIRQPIGMTSMPFLFFALTCSQTRDYDVGFIEFRHANKVVVTAQNSMLRST